MRNKNKLWKMLEREQKGVKLFYDSTKRDPQFAQGEYSFLNELFLLEKHYHPSVQRMAKFIIENYNKDIISYNGDPLLDFSLTNFLEKFMLKNPKIKKEKKEIKKIENDDDELKKFINEEENINNNIENNNKEIDDFEFIDKFNKIYPEITSDKNYLKKMKKKEKKMKTEEDVDEMIGNQEYNKDDLEIEKYADKVIDDEYKKYDKDIDDDDFVDNISDNNDENEDDNNNENEEVDDLFAEDENEGINLDENEEKEKENNKRNKNKKKEKDSGFVDAETYYKNIKNKKKKIK